VAGVDGAAWSVELLDHWSDGGGRTYTLRVGDVRRTIAIDTLEAGTLVEVRDEAGLALASAEVYEQAVTMAGPDGLQLHAWNTPVSLDDEIRERFGDLTLTLLSGETLGALESVATPLAAGLGQIRAPLRMATFCNRCGTSCESGDGNHKCSCPVGYDCESGQTYCKCVDVMENSAFRFFRRR